MSVRDDFEYEIEAFIERAGMTATAFGVEAVNDPSFVFRVRRGRNVKADTIDRVRAFMAAHRKRAKGKRKRKTAAGA